MALLKYRSKIVLKTVKPSWKINLSQSPNLKRPQYPANKNITIAFTPHQKIKTEAPALAKKAKGLGLKGFRLARFGMGISQCNRGKAAGRGEIWNPRTKWAQIMGRNIVRGASPWLSPKLAPLCQAFDVHCR